MSLTFVHISDTHISADPDYHPHWIHKSVGHPNRSVEKLVQQLNALEFSYDFILHTGDICADPTQADCEKARDILTELDKPVYMIPGNHDSAELMTQHIHDGEKLYVLRDEQMCINGYDLIGLDTNGMGDAHAPTVQDDKLVWLADTVANTDKMILAGHHPLVPTGVEWIDNCMRVQNGNTIHAILKDYQAKLCGVFHGHIHQPTNSYSDGVMYVSAPSTWYNLQADPTTQADVQDLQMSSGFNVVMIHDKRTFIRRYVL